MTALERWQAWLKVWVGKADGLSGLAFRIPVQVSTVGRWRDGATFPEADHQERLAQITGVDLAIIRDLIWNAEKERALAKRRSLEPLAPEVPAPAPFRRPRRVNGGAAAQAPPPRRGSAPDGPPAQGRRRSLGPPHRLRPRPNGGPLIGHPTHNGWGLAA